MSRQPAIWKNRRQGLNKESRKIKTNEEEKNKLDRFVDGDYETWAEEFKNDNFEDELYFENDVMMWKKKNNENNWRMRPIRMMTRKQKLTTHCGQVQTSSTSCKITLRTQQQHSL